MKLYEWRVSLLDGKRSVRISGQGIWIGDVILPWAELTEVGFVRYQVRGGKHEVLSLAVNDGRRFELDWTGPGRARLAWQEMLLAFAETAKRKRPDLDLRDGPDAQEQQTARWIGVGVAGVALVAMGLLFAAAENIYTALAGGWLGLVGCTVGALIYSFYSRRDPPPRLSWASFAAREGQSGELPAN